jgi:hypothetical protein
MVALRPHVVNALSPAAWPAENSPIADVTHREARFRMGDLGRRIAAFAPQTYQITKPGEGGHPPMP